MALGDTLRTVTLADAERLPLWRRPVALLALMAFAMPIAFATWSALLNNFVIEVAGFDGADIGWLHTVREIPGFFAIGVILLILFIREQVLAIVSLILLGAATALTAQFPSLGGLLFVTLLSSIGFHYYETVNQSLQLQWLDKKKAPQTLGWLLSVGSGATLLAYLLIVLTWRAYDLSYDLVYWVAGGVTVAIALVCFFAFPQFESPNPQTKKMVLRKRYWLYYALQFMSGARRQIFVVFAAFMMVERYEFDVHEITALFMGTLLANMIAAPLAGLRRVPFRRASGADRGICRAWHDLPALRGALRVRLGPGHGRGALRAEPPVLCAGAGHQDLLPEDRVAGRHRAHGCRGLHDQPYRGGVPASGTWIPLAVLAHLGVPAGGGDGGDFADPVLPCAATPRTGAGDNADTGRRRRHLLNRGQTCRHGPH
jgi:hypothetical protein